MQQQPHEYGKHEGDCLECMGYAAGILAATWGFAQVVGQYVQHQREDLAKLGQIAGVVDRAGEEGAKWN